MVPSSAISRQRPLLLEQINLTDGSIYTTGKTLTATDYKSVWVYPIKLFRYAFYFGKELAKLPTDPNTKLEIYPFRDIWKRWH